LKNDRYRGSQELYKTDIDKIKKLVFQCALMDKMVADNIKNKSEYDDNESVEFLDINDNVIGYEKGYKKVSKKTTKKSSKKNSKK
jgi:hypothetical protein